MAGRKILEVRCYAPTGSHGRPCRRELLAVHVSAKGDAPDLRLTENIKQIDDAGEWVVVECPKGHGAERVDLRDARAAEGVTGRGKPNVLRVLG